MFSMSKPQIIHIHGGDSFETDEQFYEFLKSCEYNPYLLEVQKWKNWIKESVADTHDYIAPQMPNALNADYNAWVIWFEKLFPYLRDNLTLIGYSLGGGFLLRYLTENKLPIVVSCVHLVAPVVDEKDCEGVGGFKIDLSTWSGFKTEPDSLHIWQSQDDPLVPTHHSERFIEKYPKAILHRFTDRGHFFQSDFPELLEELQNFK